MVFLCVPVVLLLACFYHVHVYLGHLCYGCVAHAVIGFSRVVRVKYRVVNNVWYNHTTGVSIFCGLCR